MQTTHCPLCYELLEVRDVPPYMDCGHDPTEVEHARTGKNTYAEHRVFGELLLVLCNFCDVDFTSYDPTYFDLPSGTHIGIGQRGWQFIRDIPSTITKDKCCAACGHRLPFLDFVLHARELHSTA
jgi:hypothetical protein